MPYPAVFLDRDGVLIENVPTYVRTHGEVQVFPYSTASLLRLRELGFLVFVVTNQAIVGRGLMSLEEINSIHAHIVSLVDPHGVIRESYLCPHAPDEECDCRKPLPGSLLRAATTYDLDLASSWMVGDAESDVQAGLAAGTRAILVRTGRGREQEPLVGPDIPVVDDLAAAVELIEASSQPR